MCAGGIVGILMSLVYYRAFGAPRAWLDVKARGTWRVGEQTGRRSSATGDASAESMGRRLQQDTGSLLLTQGGESVLLLLVELLRVYLSYTTGTRVVTAACCALLQSLVVHCGRGSSQQTDETAAAVLDRILSLICLVVAALHGEWGGSCCCCCWEGEEQQRLPLLRVRRQSRLVIPPSHKQIHKKWLQGYQ